MTVVVVSTISGAAQAMPQALICSFAQGHAGSFETSGFKSETPAPLSFTIVGIDLAGQSAQLKTAEDKAPGTLRIVRALNANHFIEAVTEGFLNLTTVYDAEASTQKFPAVHSRHFGVLGQAVYAQYTGFCEPAGR